MSKLIAVSIGDIKGIGIEILIKEGDHEEWIKQLSRIINYKTMSRELGEKGQRFVNETFSWEKIAKNFVDILNRYQEKKWME